MNEELFTRLGKVEQWKENAESRIKKLETDTTTLNRFAIIVELQQKTMESISETLAELKDTNKEISLEIKSIKEDIGEVKTDVIRVTQKVDSIEATDNVNIPQALKTGFKWFMSAIIAGVAGYVLFKFGIK